MSETSPCPILEGRSRKTFRTPLLEVNGSLGELVAEANPVFFISPDSGGKSEHVH